MVKEVTKKDFKDEVLASSLPVIVDFWASWCGPCQMMAPVFEKLSKEYEGKLKFVKVSTETESELAKEYEIRGIPCLKIFKEGDELGEIIGFKPEEGLREEIDKIIG